MNLHESQINFHEQYPEAGEVRKGNHLNGEQVRQFGDIISSKVFELSRKAELTDTEQTFIDRTMDLAARSIVYASDHQGLQMVDGYAAHATATAVAKIRGIAHLLIDKLPHELGGITGGEYGMRGNAAHRVLVEDAAGYSMQLFGQMAEAAGGLTVDMYLEGNLRNIVAGFEALEQQ